MQLMATMDSTIAIVTLPRIQEDLGLSDAGRSWVITAYVLTFGGLILLGGRLGDTIGRKRTFIVGVALFTIASVLCSIAWNDATLVIARLLQGVGAAIASPTGLALIATTFPKGPGRNAATAVFGAMTGVGSVMGLVVGGALAELSWRFAFLVNLPIGVRRSRSRGKQRVQHRSWRNGPVVRQGDSILRERMGVRERHREPLGRPAKMHQLRHGGCAFGQFGEARIAGGTFDAAVSLQLQSLRMRRLRPEPGSPPAIGVQG
jgi:MFS family permease